MCLALCLNGQAIFCYLLSAIAAQALFFSEESEGKKKKYFILNYHEQKSGFHRTISSS